MFQNCCCRCPMNKDKLASSPVSRSLPTHHQFLHNLSKRKPSLAHPLPQIWSSRRRLSIRYSAPGYQPTEWLACHKHKVRGGRRLIACRTSRCRFYAWSGARSFLAGPTTQTGLSWLTFGMLISSSVCSQGIAGIEEALILLLPPHSDRSFILSSTYYFDRSWQRHNCVARCYLKQEEVIRKLSEYSSPSNTWQLQSI